MAEFKTYNTETIDAKIAAVSGGGGSPLYKHYITISGSIKKDNIVWQLFFNFDYYSYKSTAYDLDSFTKMGPTVAVSGYSYGKNRPNSIIYLGTVTMFSSTTDQSFDAQGAILNNMQETKDSEGNKITSFYPTDLLESYLLYDYGNFVTNDDKFTDTVTKIA